MKQYCRYCAHAWEADFGSFDCMADDCTPRQYPIAKLKRVNKCKDFAFCGIDILTEKEYEPRVQKEKPKPQGEQLTL